MKQVIVGVYECGYEQLQLVLREGTGGEFYTVPEKGSLPRIKVGAQDPNQWRHVVATLLHEVFEWTMFRGGVRYNPDNRVSPLSQADYLFVMTHEQFQDCCAKSAEFMTKALPDLAKAYDKWHKTKSKG